MTGGALAVGKLLLILYLIPIVVGLATPPLTTAVLARASSEGVVSEPSDRDALSGVCQRGPGIRVWDGCNQYELVSLLQVGSLASAVLGSLLVGIPILLGRVGGGNRVMLALLFGPSLLVIVVGTVLLILAQAVLVSVAVVTASVMLTGLLAILVLGPALAAAYGVIAILRSSFSLIVVPAIRSEAVPVNALEQPELWAFVRDCAEQIGTSAPRNIILGLDANFWVSEIRARTPSRMCRGRTLHVSLPLCRVMESGEMRAVVGHELAHFSGADTMFTRFFYPIFRTSSDAEARLDVETESLMGAILLEPARAIFDLFFEQFRRAEARISRDRELAADARGAEISSAHDAATALVKLHLLAAVWSHTRNVVRLGELSRQPIANASMEFVRWAQDREGAPSLDRLLEERLTHPIDSHPPLADRLKALSLPEAEIAQMPAGEPLHAAIRLVNDPEDIEVGLTERLRKRVVENIR